MRSAWLCVLFAMASLQSLSLPTENVAQLVADSKLELPTLTQDMMNGKAPITGIAPSAPSAMPPAVPPVAASKIEAPVASTERATITVDVAKENKRRFDVFAATNCKNRAHIMSSYIRKISKFECQSKCAFDPSCTGYDLESSAAGEGECTIFKGECERVADNGHDLFLETPGFHDNSNLKKIPEASVEAPAVKPAAPVSAIQATDLEGDMLNITIVIPSVRRFQKDGSPAPERYLSPLVQKLWADLRPDQQKSVHFLILNADKEPEKHTEAIHLASIPSVTILSKPKSYDAVVEKALKDSGAVRENGEAFLEDGRQVSKEWIKWVASEDLDGAYLLEEGAKQSPYVLFLEDDVWPTSHALQKLTKVVRSLKKDDWLFLDLYTPNLDWAPGALDVKNGEKYAFFCCTQGMLFRSDRLPGIINYWRTHSSEPVDDNLRAYREKITPNLYIYAARPNLVEHIGAYSSNPQKSTGVIEHQSIDFVPLLLQLDADKAPASVTV